jgi:hypothetical protein
MDNRFYCLVNADVLSYGVSQQAVQSFSKLTKEYEYSDEGKLSTEHKLF